MSDIAIKIEDLGKRYKYGAVASKNDTLRADLADWVRGLFRRNSDQRSAVSGQPSELTSDLRPPISGSQPTSDVRSLTSEKPSTLDSQPSSASASTPSTLNPRHSTFRKVHEKHIAEDPNYFWALRDINLEVRRGEVVGIIGRNGAGKHLNNPRKTV